MSLASISLKPIQIGQHTIEVPIMLAPMAGITDAPFRALARAQGAGYAVSEMLTSKPGLAHTSKSHYRQQRAKGEVQAIQIVGYDPKMMAETAKGYQDDGVEIIDINMGCPAKKVCNVASGSALLRDEKLVKEILETVVAAVQIPVTLKIRTGWSPERRNAIEVARIAEGSGISMLSVHGRTRADKFAGEAEYQTIADVVRAIEMPVIANGDITSGEKAVAVLHQTGAAGIMLGRGAQGAPWLFAEVRAKMAGERYVPPDILQFSQVVLAHVRSLHKFYGERLGVRMSRKHIRWYLDKNAKYLKFDEVARDFWHNVCKEEVAATQYSMLEDFLTATQALVTASSEA